MKLLKILEFCVVLLVLVNVKHTNGRTLRESATWTNTGEGVSFNGFESIQVGGSNIPEEELISQAVAAGMDRSAVSELLRTKQPVITTDTDAKGVRRTTTYKLTNDGSISKRTETENATPLSLGIRGSFERKRPSEATSELETSASSNPTADWEWNPEQNSNTRTFTIGSTRPGNFDDSKFGTSFGSGFGTDFDDFFKGNGLTTGTRTGPVSWSNRNWISKPDADLPPGVTPKTTTKTEIDDEGRKVTTTLTTYGNIPVDQWPSTVHEKFPSLIGGNHWRRGFSDTPDKPSATYPTQEDNSRTTTTPRPTLLSFDEWKALHEATSTTTQRPRTSFVDYQPDVSLSPRVDVVLRPEPPTVPTVRTTTHFPSLSDFLKKEYGSNTPVYTFDLDKMSPLPKITKINIDELPATTIPSVSSPKIRNEIKPLIDDVWLHDLATSDVETFKLDAAPTSESGTKVKTLTQTLNSARPPTVADLDPKIQETLLRSGFTDDDLRNANGNSVSKTIVDADGRTRTTTFMIRTVPSTIETSSLQTVRQSPHQDQHIRQERALLPTFRRNQVESNSPIDSYLARVNLSAEEIAAHNGVLTQTLIENDGRILSVTFVLSTVKGNSEHVEAPMPYK